MEEMSLIVDISYILSNVVIWKKNPSTLGRFSNLGDLLRIIELYLFIFVIKICKPCPWSCSTYYVFIEHTCIYFFSYRGLCPNWRSNGKIYKGWVGASPQLHFSQTDREAGICILVSWNMNEYVLRSGSSIKGLQVNLFQKYFFLQNMGRTYCVQKLFWMSETISVYNMFSPGLSLEFSCIELVIQWTICHHIVG